MKDIEKLYTAYLAHPHVQTDTRKIAEGEIFFALKGPNFNGNNFVKQALDAGASFVVIDEGESLNDPRIFKTENALLALQELALHHRKQLHIPFIAITGSNGKTTTKELIHAVLSAQFRTSTTKGNLNNHIGVPLTILDIRTDAEIAVIEMGANHRTEIASYSAELAAKPHCVVFTKLDLMGEDYVPDIETQDAFAKQSISAAGRLGLDALKDAWWRKLLELKKVELAATVREPLAP